MKAYIFLLVAAFLHRGSAQVPENKTVMEGEQFTLVHKTSVRNTGCQFTFPASDGIPILPTPTPTNHSSRPSDWNYTLYDPCGVTISYAYEKDEGAWIMMFNGVNYIYRLIVLVPPKTVERVSPTTDAPLGAGVNTTFSCKATLARPVPQVTWKLGDETLLNGERIETKVDTLFDVQDNIIIPVLAIHDGKTLTCHYTHEAIPTESADLFFAAFNLTVQSAPDPTTGSVDYPEGSLILGQPATVRLQFHSNPEASSYIWYMHDRDPVDLNATARDFERTVQEGRYTFHPIQREGNSYWSDVTIDELLESDLNVLNFLEVTNARGSGNFTLQIENAEIVGLSSGAIAGIVIGVLLLVALVGAAIFFIVKKKKGGKKKKTRKQQPVPAPRGNDNVIETQERQV